MHSLLFFSWHLSLIGPSGGILLFLKGHGGGLFDISDSNMKRGLFIIIMRASMSHRNMICLSATNVVIFDLVWHFLLRLLVSLGFSLLVVLEVEELLEEF